MHPLSAGLVAGESLNERLSLMSTEIVLKGRFRRECLATGERLADGVDTAFVVVGGTPGVIDEMLSGVSGLRPSGVSIPLEEDALSLYSAEDEYADSCCSDWGVCPSVSLSQSWYHPVGPVWDEGDIHRIPASIRRI